MMERILLIVAWKSIAFIFHNRWDLSLFQIQVPPRGTSQQSGKIVQCYEPATMKYLGYVPALTHDEVSEYLSVTEAHNNGLKRNCEAPIT